MSKRDVVIGHGFNINAAGQAVVTITIDGDVTLLSPGDADIMADALVRHGRIAREAGAAAKAAGAGALASTPPAGRA